MGEESQVVCLKELRWPSLAFCLAEGFQPHEQMAAF